MRRLDWFLAAVVASFLVGALAMAASGGWETSIGLKPAPRLAPTDVSARRLVTRLPVQLTLPGDAR